MKKGWLILGAVATTVLPFVYSPAATIEEISVVAAGIFIASVAIAEARGQHKDA